jgi:hypothetical protein
MYCGAVLHASHIFFGFVLSTVPSVLGFLDGKPYLDGRSEIGFNLHTGLADHDNYHEYCRLLGRFKVNYQVKF